MMPPRNPRAFHAEIRRYRRAGATYGPGWDVHVYAHEPGPNEDTYELPSAMHRRNAFLDRADIRRRARKLGL